MDLHKHSATGHDGVTAHNSAPAASRLSEADGRAVDLLLDRDANPGDGAVRPFAAVASLNLQRRVAAAERVLGILRALPVPEPPADLTDRTLKRLEQAVAAPPGASASSRAVHHHPGA